MERRKNKVKPAVIMLSLVFLLVSNVQVVSANSAQMQWSGIDATGTIVTDENSPIVVEKELLTLDLQEFPESYYDSLEEYLAYSGKVTAEYTFYNPSEYTVTARLLFPFGNEPDYTLSYSYKTETYYQNADTEKFDVTVNGEVIEKSIRYSLSYWYEQFDLEKDLALLCDDYVEHEFYTPDMTVTKYTFTISDVDTEKYNAATVAFDLDTTDSERKIYMVEQSGYHTQKNGKVRLSLWADNEDTVTVYVFGKDFSEFPQWNFYKDGGVENKDKISGTITLTEKETLTFKEFALTMWNEDTGVSKMDWYNATVAMLDEQGQGMGCAIDSWNYSMDLSSYLMRWYEYEITLEPEERIVNTVTAPIYPAIDMRYEPTIYTYTYLLSPAKTWAEFGSIEIVINTPYYLTESSIEGFEKTEYGYTCLLDGLPEAELELALSTSEHPIKSATTVESYLPKELIIVVSVAGAVVLMAVGVVVLILIHRRKKHRKQLED